MPSDTRTALLSHALIGYEERKTEITETIRQDSSNTGWQGDSFAGTYPRSHSPAQARYHVPCRSETDGLDDETALGEDEEGREEEAVKRIERSPNDTLKRGAPR